MEDEIDARMDGYGNYYSDDFDSLDEDPYGYGHYGGGGMYSSDEDERRECTIM
jgi:hypothetical protein